MEKCKHRLEYVDDPPLKLARLHRQFFGRGAVSEPLLVEVEYDEHELLFMCLCEESEGLLGRAASVDKMPHLIVTPDPSLYGSDADRLAAGKLPFVEVKFGEWCALNLTTL